MTIEKNVDQNNSNPTSIAEAGTGVFINNNHGTTN